MQAADRSGSRRRSAQALLGLGACAVLVVVASGCAAQVAPSTRPNAPADDDRFERQILVTLKQPTVQPLRSAGSTRRSYVGPTDYTVSERTRRLVRQLAREHELREVDAWPIRALSIYCVVFEVETPALVEDTLRRLQGDRRVETAQPMQQFGVLAAGYNDPYAEMQHGLDSMAVWDAHQWAGGRGVTVAVIDTGVDSNHPDLMGRISVAKDFVGQRITTSQAAELHGTAVAGIIGANPNNGIGTVGVAPGVRLLALRACWAANEGKMDGVCNTFTLAKALAFAIERRPDVLNLSLSGPSDPLLERLVRAAQKEGATVVTASPKVSGGFPGSVSGVLVVDSFEASAVAGSTSPGDVPTLRAPGNEILTTTPNEAFDFVTGSSFAAAHVSGVVALLLEQQPNLEPAQILEILKDTSQRSTDGPHAGTSVVNACAALAAINERAACTPSPQPQLEQTTVGGGA